MSQMLSNRSAFLFPLIFAMSLAFLLATAARVASAENRGTARSCLVVGHRGFPRIAPENTLIALDKAIEAGADGSEFDLWPSADGTLVVMHDDNVERTTDGKGRLPEMTLAEIKKLDAGSWKDPRFAGERVPTCDEILKRLKDAHRMAVVEIKPDGIADQVVAALQAADMMDDAVVISFNKDTVKQVRALVPNLPCALICNDKKPERAPAELFAENTVKKPVELADWLAAQARQCNTDMLDLNQKLLTKEVVDRLRQQKMTVWVYGVDDPARMDEMIGWGIPSITTNSPDVLRARVDEAAKKGK